MAALHLDQAESLSAAAGSVLKGTPSIYQQPHPGTTVPASPARQQGASVPSTGQQQQQQQQQQPVQQQQQPPVQQKQLSQQVELLPGTRSEEPSQGMSGMLHVGQKPQDFTPRGSNSGPAHG